MTKKVADKSTRNAALAADLKRMADKGMANYFARAYYNRSARAFEKWKLVHKENIEKEAIMRRTLNHWLKQNGKYLLAVFANWKAQAKINDTKKAILDLENGNHDHGIIMTGSATEFQAQKESLLA